MHRLRKCARGLHPKRGVEAAGKRKFRAFCSMKRLMYIRCLVWSGLGLGLSGSIWVWSGLVSSSLRGIEELPLSPPPPPPPARIHVNSSQLLYHIYEAPPCLGPGSIDRSPLIITYWATLSPLGGHLKNEKRRKMVSCGTFVHSQHMYSKQGAA